MRVFHIVIRGMSGFAVFSTLTHKRQDLKKKKILNTKCDSF